MFNIPITFGEDKSMILPCTCSVLLAENNLLCTTIMNEKTAHEYKEVIASCKALFARKTHDYGTAWRVLRLSSITDQIYIKAQRIRSIQEKGTQKVEDPIKDEFVGIINYCIIAMIQLKLTESDKMDLTFVELEPLYDTAVNETFDLLQNKNHDYAEAWRDMRVSSMTDIILMKLLRVKQIEDNQGKTLASEGVRANYQDMINYSVFCLMKLK
jgi:Nucleotide modification associated domain 1